MTNYSDDYLADDYSDEMNDYLDETFGDFDEATIDHLLSLEIEMMMGK